MEHKHITVIGAGFAGLSAARTLAEAGWICHLVSSQMSERAQSVLAEGGINAALDTMGENDTTEEHYADTMRGGCDLASKNAVRALTEEAPHIVRDLARLGVPFQKNNGELVLRNFGGQKKKRTAYARSSTGKMMMTGMIDAVRRYEASGQIIRYGHHDVTGFVTENGVLKEVLVQDRYSGEGMAFTAPVILCAGGINGFFGAMTTGTTQNTGNAAAYAFDAGAAFANLEFIQYHPTTVGITDKRMLVSEAARGEGGRLFVMRNGKPWYFMEEKYPELGNLMPRDVISREMAFLQRDPECTGDIFLDLRGLPEETWKRKLSDLRKEIQMYLGIDAAVTPVPVSPGIHFFMGGLCVDDHHASNIKGLYAAGECACKYHGANRLGGNSMLAAIYGGTIAAQSAMASNIDSCIHANAAIPDTKQSSLVQKQMEEILLEGLGIVRTEETMKKAESRLAEMMKDASLSRTDRCRLQLSFAMVESALARKESRGAHYRTDYPERSTEYQKETAAVWTKDGVKITFRDPEEDLA